MAASSTNGVPGWACFVACTGVLVLSCHILVQALPGQGFWAGGPHPECDSCELVSSVLVVLKPCSCTLQAVLPDITHYCMCDAIAA